MTDLDADSMFLIISIIILIVFMIFLFISYLGNSCDSPRRKEYVHKIAQVRSIVLNKDTKSKYVAFRLLTELGDLVATYDELAELNELKWAVYEL